MPFGLEKLVWVLSSKHEKHTCNIMADLVYHTPSTRHYTTTHQTVTTSMYG